MRNLIILGAGGTAYDLIDIAVAMNKVEEQWNILGFLDDNPELLRKMIYGYPVLGTIPQSETFQDAFLHHLLEMLTNQNKKSC